MFQMLSWHKLINFKTSAGFLRKHGVHQTVNMLSSALLVDMLIQKGNVAQFFCFVLFFGVLGFFLKKELQL